MPDNYIETYRNVRIYCRYCPTFKDHTYVAHADFADFAGIWPSIQGLRDYIDWKLNRKSEV